MTFQLALFALGLILLLVGGGMLVRGASEIAARLSVSPLIVGFGTSTPELPVNVTGAMQGAMDLAFGNVVGSNIAALLIPVFIFGRAIMGRKTGVALLAVHFGYAIARSLDYEL